MKKFKLSFLLTILLLSMMATAAFAAGSDPANNDPIVPGGHNQAINSSNQEPTNENANTTGVGVDTQDNFANVIKNVDGHKTHGEYQNNTNSCASCHQTHTSKGKQLLFGDSVGETCAACHDGTLGFYNVFTTGAAAGLDGAGTFAGTEGASMHQANDIVKISAAPGGNLDETSGNWGADFSCASCHAPHGSYSDRLLHYNPNGMATFPQTTVGTATYGNQLKDINVVDLSGGLTATAGSDAYVLGYTDATPVVGTTLYLYKNTQNSKTKVWSYVKQTTPMLYGYGSHGSPHYTHIAYTDLNETDVDKQAKRIEYGNADIAFHNEEGSYEVLTAKGVEILTSANNYTLGKTQVSLAYVVKMDLQEVDDIDGLKIYKNNQSAYWTERSLANQAALIGDPELGKDMTGAGIAMSNYCASCHVDYFVKSSSGAGVKSGTFSAAYRHTTTSSSYACVRCHYAHGTDANIMLDAEGKTVADLAAPGGKFDGNAAGALDYMKDQNNSSALKKFTNMTVCWACHNSSKATTIKNTNRNADHPNGMPITSVDFGGTPADVQR